MRLRAVLVNTSATGNALPRALWLQDAALVYPTTWVENLESPRKSQYETYVETGPVYAVTVPSRTTEAGHAADVSDAVHRGSAPPTAAGGKKLQNGPMQALANVRLREAL